MSGQIWRKNAKIKESLAFVKKIQILVIDTEGIKRERTSQKHAEIIPGHLI
jgi:hypothetical protein